MKTAEKRPHSVHDILTTFLLTGGWWGVFWEDAVAEFFSSLGVVFKKTLAPQKTKSGG
ncbi:MAG: hypothetical protein II458_05800 [Oscillospiraceae bacterium]|nr:hypothetical protein [Oscillospiraceae bacterium]